MMHSADNNWLLIISIIIHKAYIAFTDLLAKFLDQTRSVLHLLNFMNNLKDINYYQNKKFKFRIKK